MVSFSVCVWFWPTNSSPNLSGPPIAVPFFVNASDDLVAIGGDAEERDVLVVGAVVAAGLEAVRLELRGDVLLRDLVAARAGAAAFEQVAGEELIVGSHRLAAEQSHAAFHGGGWRVFGREADFVAAENGQCGQRGQGDDRAQSVHVDAPLFEVVAAAGSAGPGRERANHIADH